MARTKGRLPAQGRQFYIREAPSRADSYGCGEGEGEGDEGREGGRKTGRFWRIMGTEGQKLTTLQRRITALKEKRAAKEEKARYEKLAETMHRKRVERLKRKEKRNKMLKS
jgi:hypothetical protein